MDKNVLIKKMVSRINSYSYENEINIMEVCGTHTNSIYKYGINNMFSNIKLISGPGCPVCIVDEAVIDTAIEIANKEGVILVIFGDMLNVKGSKKSLKDSYMGSENIKVIQSLLDILKIAEENKDKMIVFFGVGFETTASGIAMTICNIEEECIDNIYFLLSLNLMKPIIHNTLKDRRNKLNGIICPGHVATIMGSEHFRFISDEYNISTVVSGFKPLDIIGGIYAILNGVNEEKLIFENLYKDRVKKEGNFIAKKTMSKAFSVEDGYLRGIGKVENSQLVLKDKYSKYDAVKKFNIKLKYKNSDTYTYKDECKCRDIILGNKLPQECKLFGNTCSPNSPFGSCMVSAEGTCYINYKYIGSVD